LDRTGSTQYVYVPYRILKKEKKVRLSNPESKIMLRPIYNQLSRLAYFYKINKAYVDLSERVPLSDVNVIHAHTWFTDGGLAYKIYKRHSIPYVITVRSTDLSAFARYFYHTHRYARNVLLNAKRIIFLSETYKNQVLQLPFIKK